ncbi:DUF397 domain-containing protein [Streptomyces anulatus]
MNRPKADLYAHDLSDSIWRKSSASGAEHDCVEIAELPGGARAVRDSKNPERPPLCFTASEWAAFRAGVLADEF